MPALPANPPPERWTSVTQYATQDGILVNQAGERFFDESRSMADEVAATQLLRQPGARAFLLVDRRIHDDVPLPGRSPARDRPQLRERRRSRYAPGGCGRHRRSGRRAGPLGAWTGPA